MLNQREANGANAYWPILGVGGYTVTALGLHRDGTAFSGLSPYETEERRKVFWEMMTLDRLQAMCFARPCALSNRSVDTKFPGEDALIGEEGLPDQDHFHDAKYRLVYIMDKVIDEQTKTSRTSYKDILAIDDEIQKFAKNLPREMQPGVKASSLEMGPEVNPHTILHRFSIRLLIQETVIYLHRAYFVKAIEEVCGFQFLSVLNAHGCPSEPGGSLEIRWKILSLLPQRFRSLCRIDQHRQTKRDISPIVDRKVSAPVDFPELCC
jgi:hypothetical protein